MNVIENYHMIFVENTISSYEACMISGKPEYFDCLEKDDLEKNGSFVPNESVEQLVKKVFISLVIGTRIILMAIDNNLLFLELLHLDHLQSYSPCSISIGWSPYWNTRSDSD